MLKGTGPKGLFTAAIVASTMALAVAGCGQVESLGSVPAAPEAVATAPVAATTTATSVSLSWTHLSSSDGALPVPGTSRQQTAALVLDVNKNGRNDFVIGAREAGPALVWYERTADGWTVHTIEPDTLPIEAGGAFYDIDGDGDLDIVMGGDYSSNKVWWWENPYPDFSSPWMRREIKNSGQNKHHDQMFGDFDGDGQAELVFWNQNAQTLYLAEIPANPRATSPWPLTAIYTWSGGDEHEGLAQADIDGDGKVDIIGGGRWYKHNGGTSYTANVIDDTQRFSRAVAGQLKAGGRPEVVFVKGDGVGRLKWYEWDGSAWIGRDLLGFDVDHGHTLELGDVDGDGHLDIFCAEMRLDGGNSDAKMWIFLGDGQGNFTKHEVATGYGNHESRLADLDGDGDLDILGKPYNWQTPRVDIWLNGQAGRLSLDKWQRHVVDANRPWTAIFITAADVDGDGHQDILTGGWWYRNPGPGGGAWERTAFGSPLNNLAAAHDFDGDGHVDVLGTAGQGSNANSTFVWGRNDGSGRFTIHQNVASGDGDFLQGVAVGPLGGQGLEVALSWHQAGKGIQRLHVPADPAGTALAAGPDFGNLAGRSA
jgi:hypothetical protein